MRFLCLVYGAAGNGADKLRPAATATTVRVRDGQTVVRDGPFAEPPEELTAFRVVECDDLDEALAAAAELRAAAVEVRPEYLS
jgi:hypothetical protein